MGCTAITDTDPGSVEPGGGGGADGGETTCSSSGTLPEGYNACTPSSDDG